MVELPSLRRAAVLRIMGSDGLERIEAWLEKVLDPKTGRVALENPTRLEGCVDEWVGTIGSANMDIRSFHLNYEVTAMLYDGPVNRALAEIFERDQGLSIEVDPDARARLSAFRSAAEAAGLTVFEEISMIEGGR